jgi:hypothetical protein
LSAERKFGSEISPFRFAPEADIPSIVFRRPHATEISRFMATRISVAGSGAHCFGPTLRRFRLREAALAEM